MKAQKSSPANVFRFAALVALCVGLSSLWMGCGTPSSNNSNNNTTGDVTYTQVFQSVFQGSCAFQSCHGGGAGGLTLNADDGHANLVGVDSNLASGQKRVVAGDPDNSVLFQVLKDKVGSIRRMPPAEALPQDKLDMVESWIKQGAKK